MEASDVTKVERIQNFEFTEKEVLEILKAHVKSQGVLPAINGEDFYIHKVYSVWGDTPEYVLRYWIKS